MVCSIGLHLQEEQDLHVSEPNIGCVTVMAGDATWRTTFASPSEGLLWSSIKEIHESLEMNYEFDSLAMADLALILEGHLRSKRY